MRDLSTILTADDLLTPTNGQPTEKATGSKPNHTTTKQFCGSCGHQNSGAASMCLNCGTALGAVCPSCKQPVPVGSKFCGQCGTRMSNAQPASQHEALQTKMQPNLRERMPTALTEKISAASVKTLSERREVTVLFLDVTNFTAASHNLDSEDVYDFINEAMSTLVEVVCKYGGTIDKFTGDGLMALFGAPVAHEDDPERAIRAALEMQIVLKPLQKHIRHVHSLNFKIRIGINTGWVIAGKVGNKFHKEYTVIGDTVNLAARLESAAEPGSILVSAETHQRTRTRIKDASIHAETALQLSDSINSQEPQIESRWLLALIHAEQNDAQIGLQFAQEALNMAQSAGLIEKETDCLRALGVVHARLEQFEDAETTLDAAIELARKQNDPYRHGHALLNLSQLYQHRAQAQPEAGNQWKANVRLIIHKAIHDFESIGAAHDLRLAQLIQEQVKA